MTFFIALALQPLAADLIDDPVVLALSRELARASLVDRTREHGGFVVLSPAGTLYFVEWPRSGSAHVLRWRGPFPRGTLAIIHTHPGWIPYPSKLDRRTAARTGVPVYVITPRTITKTSGDAGEIVARDWMDGRRNIQQAWAVEDGP